MDNKFYSDLYNELYDNYGYSPGVKRSSIVFRPSLDQLSKIQLKLLSNWILLDMGCSKGGFLKCVKESYTSDCDLHGIDVSKKAILEANQINDINCIEGNIINTPYDDEFFDVIHTTDVLEHLLSKDRNIALKEIHRILKPNGIFFGAVATTYETGVEMKNWAKYIKEEYNIEDLHIDPITAEEWLEIFEMAGFEILWHEVFTRKDCRSEKQGFTTGIGQCHVKFRCQKNV